MKKPIAKIGRSNHLNHMTKVIPIIALVYILQSLFLVNIVKSPGVNNLCFFIGIGLVSFISLLIYYDNNHHVILFEEHLEISLFPFKKKVIHFKYIQSILCPKNECKFSVIVLKTKDQGNVTIHFVDFPLSVKKLIMKYKAQVVTDHYKEWDLVLKPDNIAKDNDEAA